MPLLNHLRPHLSNSLITKHQQLNKNIMTKSTKILYWVFTILISVFMVFSGIQEIINNSDSVKIITGIGFPANLNPLLGVAKLLAVVAILIPGYPRLKEWAYAGLTFDLIGATYAIIAVGTPVNKWIFMLLFFAVLAAAYIFYRKKLNQTAKN